MFEGTAARVTIHYKGRTEVQTLTDVPMCGLRFGAGLYDEVYSVTLIASSVDAAAE